MGGALALIFWQACFPHQSEQKVFPRCVSGKHRRPLPIESVRKAASRDREGDEEGDREGKRLSDRDTERAVIKVSIFIVRLSRPTGCPHMQRARNREGRVSSGRAGIG